jgi:hypothetical protein
MVIGAFFGGVSVGRRCHEIEHERAWEQIREEKEQLFRLQERVGAAAGQQYDIPAW